MLSPGQGAGHIMCMKGRNKHGLAKYSIACDLRRTLNYVNNIPGKYAFSNSATLQQLHQETIKPFRVTMVLFEAMSRQSIYTNIKAYKIGF